jgi:Zn-dependent protease with chaperone function
LALLLVIGLTIALAGSVDIGPVLGLVVFLVIGQWALGPEIVQWAIPAREIPHDDHGYQTHDPIGAIVARRCRDSGVPLVRLGVVDDGVPNALTFGRTRRGARVWVTRGLLERLDEDELDAVVAHELGHVRNRDFVLMTIAAVVPLLLYALARALIDADDGGDDDDEGGAALLGLAVFVCYLVSEFVLLWLSRTREFAADHWSCECTGNGDALVSALVKIGYGMTVSSAVAEASEKKAQADPKHATSAKSEKQEVQASRRTHLMRTMGIFDQSAAGGMVNGFLGGVDAQRAVAALRWEASNPWAVVFEKLSTHPLVGRRIAALEESGLAGRPTWLGLQAARLGTDPSETRHLRARFLADLTAVLLPWVTLFTALFLLWEPADSPWPAGLLLAGSGVLFALAHARRYPFEFAPVDGVTNLLERIDASPVRGIPVEVRGRIVGRATPGYVLSSDLVLEDGSGIVALGYVQPVPFADALFGFLRAKQFIDCDVVARGWYRRAPNPVIELRELRAADGRAARPYLWLVRFVTAGALVVVGLAVTAVQLATNGG